MAVKSLYLSEIKMARMLEPLHAIVVKYFLKTFLKWGIEKAILLI